MGKDGSAPGEDILPAFPSSCSRSPRPRFSRAGGPPLSQLCCVITPVQLSTHPPGCLSILPPQSRALSIEAHEHCLAQPVTPTAMLRAQRLSGHPGLSPSHPGSSPKATASKVRFDRMKPHCMGHTCTHSGAPGSGHTSMDSDCSYGPPLCSLKSWDSNPPMPPLFWGVRHEDRGVHSSLDISAVERFRVVEENELPCPPHQGPQQGESSACWLGLKGEQRQVTGPQTPPTPIVERPGMILVRMVSRKITESVLDP